MKKIYTLIILPIAVASAVLSCSRLVEADPPTDQIGTDAVFADVQTADAALAAVYAALYTDSFIAGDNAGALLGSYTDELICYYPNNTNGPSDIYSNQVLPTNSLVERTWSSSYRLIYMANAIIEGVERSTAIQSAERDRIKGEALFIRSLLYYYLHQLYGDVPYAVSTDYEVNRRLKKLSVAEMQLKLITDLTEAIGLLPTTYRSAERIYVSRPAAELLLGQLYLLQKKWPEAEQQARKLADNTLFTFENDPSKVFNKNGRHIIWQLKPKNSGDPTKEAMLYYFANSVPNAYALTDNLVNSFEPGDKRRTAWIALVTHNGQTYHRPVKYRNISANTTEYSIVFRLEEAYFILAEALIRQERRAEALPYLNATRGRAGLAAVSTADDLLQVLLDEKRHEFFTERGMRFLDLKRLGRLNDLKAIKPNWKDFNSLWPLPQNELLLNPNLQPQNPGY